MEISSTTTSSNASSDSSSKPSCSTTTTTSSSNTSSDQLVSLTMQKGFEKIVIQTSIGFALGGLAGLLLTIRRPLQKSPLTRKGFIGLGTGIGLGSSWTRTSMDLEELLTPNHNNDNQKT